MDISEVKVGSCVVVEHERNGMFSVVVGTVAGTGLSVNVIPSIDVVFTIDDGKLLPDYYMARSVYIVGETVSVFYDVEVSRNAMIFTLTCKSHNALEGRRDSERYYVNAGGLISIEGKESGLFPVKFRDLSKNGAGIYVMKDYDFLPGDVLNMQITEQLPEKVDEGLRLGNILKAVVLHIREADYGRLLLGTSFI